MPGPLVQPASLAWENGAPRSLQFDDIYYSGQGPEEALHVFLNGNNLPERWLNTSCFVIAETGFGTGLNFLVTLHLWKRTAPPGAILHYLAVERYPLALGELAKAVSSWPQLSAEAQSLLAQWPALEPGWRRLRFVQGRVLLTLMYGDCAAVLRAMTATVDAWYLDGFAPSRNPEMWSPQVLGRVAELTRAQGRLATFTVAGHVRRSLIESGFELAKLPGFGNKREMLVGIKRGSSQSRDVRPWFRPPAPEAPAERRASVIGAGLAGCAVTLLLVERGWQVTLFDREERPCRGASGNPAGVLMPLLEASPSPRQRWYQTGSRHTLNYLAAHGEELQWRPCGVFATAWNVREKIRHRKILRAGIWDPGSIQAVAADGAGSLAGMPMSHGGLFLPDAGWVNPASLCGSWLAKAPALVTTHWQSKVASLVGDGSQWQVTDQAGKVLDSAPVVVLCAGTRVPGFCQTDWLPLTAVRGQLTALAATAESVGLGCVVTGNGYLLPATAECHHLGATYDVGDQEQALRARDHQRNLANLSGFFPAFAEQARAQVVGGRVAFRSVTDDYLPVAGPVPDVDAWQRDYGNLHLGRRAASYPPPTNHRGLYVVAGLGSRGLASASLAAELVVSMIAGEPSPVEADLAAAVHPGRFLIRRFRRKPR